MAKKVFKLNPLSSSSITALQKQLREYRDSLDNKCERFVRELAESGISVAKVNTDIRIVTTSDVEISILVTAADYDSTLLELEKALG